MSSWRHHRVVLLSLLAIYAALVLLAGLGRLPLYGRDESLYAEAAREMHASGDWVVPRVNGVEFLEKPPLNYWLAAASYRVFGVSPLAARIPAALLGLATVLLVAGIGMRLWGRRAGLLAGFVLASCLQMAFIARLGIMDVPLMFLTTWALSQYVRWRQTGRLRAAVAFGLLVGLAMLLKSLAGSSPRLVVFVHAVAFRRPRGRPGGWRSWSPSWWPPRWPGLGSIWWASARRTSGRPSGTRTSAAWATPCRATPAIPCTTWR